MIWLDPVWWVNSLMATITRGYEDSQCFLPITSI